MSSSAQESNESVPDISGYDTVFVGYPLWATSVPQAVLSFLNEYDLSEKTVIPFCTSGGSGMGSSATKLEQLTDGADWLSGKRLHGSDTQDTVMEWVNSFGLAFRE